MERVVSAFYVAWTKTQKILPAPIKRMCRPTVGLRRSSGVEEQGAVVVGVDQLSAQPILGVLLPQAFLTQQNQNHNQGTK